MDVEQNRAKRDETGKGQEQRAGITVMYRWKVGYRLFESGHSLEVDL
jgi:hypothetical protein